MTVNPVTAEDVEFIASRLRAADLAELKAASESTTPLETIQRALIHSDEAFVYCNGDTPVAIGGVVHRTEIDGAAPWLLGTEDIFKHPKTLITASTKKVNEWLAKYKFLTIAVHVENEHSIQFIEHLKFNHTNTVKLHDWFYIYTRSLENVRRCKST